MNPSPIDSTMNPAPTDSTPGDRFLLEAASTPDSRAHFATMPDPGAGYQIYQNTLAMSSHSPQGRLTINFELSGTKCSLSGKTSFYLALDVENNTNLPLAVAQGEPIKVESSAHSRGPEIKISNAETREFVAAYRFEICSVPDIDRIVKTSDFYEHDDFDHLLPGRTESFVIDINDHSLFRDQLCDDFMNKVTVGAKYMIEIQSSTWEEHKTSPVRCQVWRKGPNVFEVVE